VLHKYRLLLKQFEAVIAIDALLYPTVAMVCDLYPQVWLRRSMRSLQ
jgi:hypothetical protein